MNGRAGECEQCTAQVQPGQRLCGWCVSDSGGQSPGVSSSLRVDGRHSAGCPSPTLFEEGLALLLLVAGCVWEYGARVWQAAKVSACRWIDRRMP